MKTSPLYTQKAKGENDKMKIQNQVKTIVAIGFAVMMLFSVTFMQLPEANAQTTLHAAKNAPTSGKSNVTAFQYGKNKTNTKPSPISPDTANGGTVYCNAYVNTASPCEGQGSGYLSSTDVETPYLGEWVTGDCGGQPCVTTDWSTWGYPTTINVNGDTYTFYQGQMDVCAGTWCSSPVANWSSTGGSPDILIEGAPEYTPLTIYAYYIYKDQNGNYDNLELDQDLTLGYG